MTEHINLTPQYPGDAVRTQELERDGEFGDVRIQWYDSALHVGSFLPGRDVFFPGDTPKVEPEKSTWCEDRALADRLFDVHVAEALADGWVKL